MGSNEGYRVCGTKVDNSMEALCTEYNEYAVAKKEDIDDSVLTKLSQIFEEKNGEVELKKK